MQNTKKIQAPRTVEPEDLHASNTQAFDQQASNKLDRSSGLGYHRINGEVEHLERSVARTHITNRRNAHFVRSSTRAARKYPGLPVDSNVIMVMERPGDREQLNQSTSEQRSKHRGPTSTINRQASKALVQQTSKHGPRNKFQAPVTEVLD